MRKPFTFSPGGIVSADIAVPQHDVELNFYKAILTTGPNPLWQEDLLNSSGTPVIGLGERTPEYEMVPLQWMPHFQVADVAASTNLATELGGKIILRDESEGSPCQWACIEDVNGTAFGVIPVVPESQGDAEAFDQQGRIAWLSLWVADSKPICKFYEQVVGWSVDSDSPASAEQPPRFEMLTAPDISAAEIVQCDPETLEIPAVWLIHLPVGDLSESLRLVGELGGSVVRELADPKHAIIRDPVGVYFALQEN
ncbi:MAG: VOC family protein [Aureliella sp.]